MASAAAAMASPLIKRRERTPTPVETREQTYGMAARASEATRIRETQRQRSRKARAPSSSSDSSKKGQSPAQSGGLVSTEHGSNVEATSATPATLQAVKPAYDLKFSVQPPTDVRADTVLAPPIVVEIRHRQSSKAGEATAEDSGLLWASASLMDETGETMLAPPRTDLLKGSLVDSARPLAGSQDDDDDDDDNDDDGEVDARHSTTGSARFTTGDSCVVFPNLSIKESGSYRLQITLSRLNAGGPTASPSQMGTLTVAKVQSRRIRVT